MAKKFMYVCLGVLALVLAFHLGAQYGQAGYVEHSGRIIATVDPSNINYVSVLLDNGEIWTCDLGTGGWMPSGSGVWPTCPVSASQVKFILNDHVFISLSDDLWYWDSGPQVWRNAGSPSGGVATEPSTWGNIKAKWRDTDG